MSLTVDEARAVSSLRLRMIENMQNGKPAHEGVDENELRSALEKVRKQRSIGAGGSGKSSSRKSTTVPVDLGEFMK